MKKNIIFFFLLLMMMHFSFSKNSKKTRDWIHTTKKNSFVVKNIQIIGKTKYDPIFISNLSRIFPGNKIDLPGKEIDHAIKKLWESNLFKTISIYKKHRVSSSKNNEIDLFFDLEDSIEIHKINIKGTGTTQFNTVQQIHKEKEDKKISYDLIQSIHNEIEDYYLKKGYKEISIKKEIIPCNNKNILNISVEKGKKIWIENIFFDGNKILNPKILLNLMVKTRKKFYIPIIEKPFFFVYENIKDDLKNIKDKYLSMGFLDIQVILDSIWKEESGNYSIKIKVIEGEKYYLGNVNFVGNTVFKTDLLRKIFLYKEGDVYDKIGINNNIANATYASSIISNYLDLGYFFVKIIPVETKIDNKNQIHLEIKIEENNPVYINKVNISGNTITKDHVIRRELTTYPGDIFSPRKIKSSLLRLVNLNLFDNNKINTSISRSNKDNDRVNIEWRVVEKGSNQIQLHGGYEKGKLIGNFKLSFGNFSIGNFYKLKYWKPIPQGDGQKLLLFSQFGKDKKFYGISFTEPWIEKTTPTSITFEINFLKKKIKNDESFYFSTKKFNSETEKHEVFLEKIGASIHLNKFLTFLDPYSKIGLSIDYDKFVYNKNLDSDHKERFFQFNNLSYLISLKRFYGEPDLIYPINGSKIQVNTIFTLPYSIIFNYDDENKFDWMEFFKFKITSFWYKKIIDQMVVKIGGEFGMLGKYNHAKKLFPFQKFYMGGTALKLEDRDHIPLRGYSSPHMRNNHLESSITPNDGGIIYNKSIFEIRYLIKTFSSNISKFWTFVFIEGGSISDSYKKFNPLFKMNKSFGFGFRIYFSPIGFFGIDFGYPINKEKNHFLKSKWKTHFIVGKD